MSKPSHACIGNDCTTRVSVRGSRCRPCHLAHVAKQPKHYECIESGCESQVADVGRRCRPCYLRSVRVRPAKPRRGTPRKKLDSGQTSFVPMTPRRGPKKPASSASQTPQQRTKMRHGLESGRIRGVLIIGSDWYTLNGSCKLCGKMVLDPGLCFTCATGRPITLPIRARVLTAASLAAESTSVPA